MNLLNTEAYKIIQDCEVMPPEVLDALYSRLRSDMHASKKGKEWSNSPIDFKMEPQLKQKLQEHFEPIRTVLSMNLNYQIEMQAAEDCLYYEKKMSYKNRIK